MIRTTLSCCALFGCLLGITFVIRQQDESTLRPVERPPQLTPAENDAEPASRTARQGPVVPASAELPVDAEQHEVGGRNGTNGREGAGGPEFSLALNQPIAKPGQPAPVVDARDLRESNDRIFQLLLRGTNDRGHYRIADEPAEEDSRSAEDEWVTTVRDTRSEVAEPAANPALQGDVAPLDETVEETLEQTADETAEPSTARSAAPAETGEPRPPLTPELLELRDRIRSCLSYYYARPENAATRSPWGVMHSLIAFGVDTQLIAGQRRVNAIGWLCWNQPCRGQRLFYVRDGRLHTANGPGVQGHEGQFLAMLAQSKVRRDYELRVDGHRFTIQDLVEMEQRTCRPRSELTFKLIGLAHYLDSDAVWTCEGGESWSIPRLIREELEQPVVGAACGGTHRMMGFSYAVRKRQERGEPLEGQWLRAKKYVDAYHEYTFRLQNADGSFSTDWFRSRADSSDIQRRVQTTGHILEWLIYSLPADQLDDPRLVYAVRYLTDLMTRHREWEIGPQGHALHALVLYDERVFRDRDETPAADAVTSEEPTAEAPATDAVTAEAPATDAVTQIELPESPEFESLGDAAADSEGVSEGGETAEQKQANDTRRERMRWLIRWRDR